MQPIQQGVCVDQQGMHRWRVLQVVGIVVLFNRKILKKVHGIACDTRQSHSPKRIFPRRFDHSRWIMAGGLRALVESPCLSTSRHQRGGTPDNVRTIRGRFAPFQCLFRKCFVLVDLVDTSRSDFSPRVDASSPVR
jgi:hypothetical protein